MLKRWPSYLTFLNTSLIVLMIIIMPARLRLFRMPFFALFHTQRRLLCRLNCPIFVCDVRIMKSKQIGKRINNVSFIGIRRKNVHIIDIYIYICILNSECAPLRGTHTCLVYANTINRMKIQRGQNYSNYTILCGNDEKTSASPANEYSLNSTCSDNCSAARSLLIYS